MSNQVMKYCKNCGRQTIHLQPSTSHVLHLLMTILTFGVWVIVWFLVAQSNSSQSKCAECGREVGLFGSSRGGSKQAAGPTPDTHVKCPDCAELVLKEARVCKHCGCRLVPQ